MTTTPTPWEPTAREVLSHGARTHNGMLLDHVTASMLVSIHDGLHEENRAKFAAMPLEKAVTFGWKLLKRVEARS